MKDFTMIVSLMKWPVGLGVLLLTPAAAFSTFNLIRASGDAGLWTSPFAIGFLASFVFLLLFHRARFIQLWATIDHEATHALFAWLTLVPVREISATDGSMARHNGGRLGHVALGGDNWLISLSPYFFPTAPFVVIALVWLLASEPTSLAGFILGATTAWAVVSTWHETHFGQTDLHQTGVLFAILFLPGANLLCYGALIANELGGPGRTLEFALSAVEITLRWVAIGLQ
jgi:multisubunit Na+/H+ antiporter MnhE subunit